MTELPVEPPERVPLVTAEQLGALTGVSLAPERARVLIEAASAHVRSHCGWHLAPSTVEEFTVDGSGARAQPLPTLYMSDLLVLEIEGWPVDVDTVEWSAGGVLCRSRPFPCRPRSVVAVVEHGHQHLTEVAAVCAAMIARAANAPAGMAQLQVMNTNMTYDVTSPGAAGALVMAPHELALLERYRLPSGP